MEGLEGKEGRIKDLQHAKLFVTRRKQHKETSFSLFYATEHYNDHNLLIHLHISICSHKAALCILIYITIANHMLASFGSYNVHQNYTLIIILPDTSKYCDIPLCNTRRVLSLTIEVAFLQRCNEQYHPNAFNWLVIIVPVVEGLKVPCHYTHLAYNCWISTTDFVLSLYH